MFEKISWLQGRRFKYTAVDDSLKKRELQPALDLLINAGVAYKVLHTSAQGLPLGAQSNLDVFKLMFLDIGIAQTLLGPGQSGWLIDPLTSCVNKGTLCEMFVGQELIAYGAIDYKPAIYCWVRESRSSNAEVDYVASKDNFAIPVEVKSGALGRLKSVQLFLEEHKETPYALRLYSGKYHCEGKIISYPLYATAFLFRNSKAMLC